MGDSIIDFMYEAPNGSDTGTSSGYKFKLTKCHVPKGTLEAIVASHAALKRTAEKAQKQFGTGFLNAGFVAACLRDGYEYDRSIIAGMKTLWQPIIMPDAAALGGIGDAVYKINEAAPGYIGRETLRQITGLEGDDEQ